MAEKFQVGKLFHKKVNNYVWLANPQPWRIYFFFSPIQNGVEEFVI